MLKGIWQKDLNPVLSPCIRQVRSKLLVQIIEKLLFSFWDALKCFIILSCLASLICSNCLYQIKIFLTIPTILL